MIDSIIDQAPNGKIAYELAMKNKYSLIFMDCSMPIMNGFEATM
jgi:YesN/AraC family two-component response regulator